MREFRVAGIRGGHWREPRADIPCRQVRKKFSQPIREFLWRQYPSHHVSFRQRWRKKVFAGRFVGQRTIAVLQIETEGTIFKKRQELLITAAVSIYSRPNSREGLITVT